MTSRYPRVAQLRSHTPTESSGSADGLIEHLLAVARDRLGMELSWVSSFRGELQVFDHIGGDTAAFGLSAGDSLSLSGSYCLRVAEGRLPSVIVDTTLDEATARLSVTNELGLGSYVGAPIKSDNDLVGMLCCVSRGPSPHLRSDDSQTLELIAQLIGELVTKEGPTERRDRAVTASVSNTIVDRTFHTVFQPIVEIDSGAILGVEALTRFDESPSRPDTWFADAASVGLGVELEIAAISSALKRLIDLPAKQFMMLNASPETIRDPRLVAVLEQYEPARCVVEVTEQAVVDDYSVLARWLESLRNIGVRIAVDDVGAGFASLAHVLELQPTIIKIDRSIVKSIHADPARQALAQAVMGVAERLGATVIGEGIEAAEELDALGALGVQQAQGFLLGRPQAELPISSHVPMAASRPNADLLDPSEVANELAVRRFELAMLHSPVGMAVISLDGSFIHINPAYASFLGRTERDFVDRGFQDFTHPDDLHRCEDLVAECLDGNRDSYRVEKRYQHVDGSIVWGEVSVVLVKASGGRPLYFIAQVQDISDRHERERALATRATTDHLTAIANRSAASEYLDELADSSTPFGVLYCDLRNFKSINDTHGHRAGDHVLIAVAERIKQISSPNEHVSRWGGDEFLVIVPGATDASLDALATQVAATVARPVSLHPGDQTAQPTITVGRARFNPDGADSVDAVLHRADSHMYDQRGTHRPARNITP